METTCRGYEQHDETGMVRACTLPVGHEGRHEHHAIPGSIGPFPVEPSPGSPEAIAQAGETLREMADDHIWADTYELLKAEPDSGIWYLDEDTWRRANSDWASRYVRHELLRVVGERDKLAADLESSRLLCGRLADALELLFGYACGDGEPGDLRWDSVYEKCREALQKAGRS